MNNVSSVSDMSTEGVGGIVYASLFYESEEGNVYQIGEEIGIPVMLRGNLLVPEEYKGYGIRTFWKYYDHPYSQRVFTDSWFPWSNNWG
jgi:hypothetical protein